MIRITSLDYEIMSGITVIFGRFLRENTPFNRRSDINCEMIEGVVRFRERKEKKIPEMY